MIHMKRSGEIQYKITRRSQIRLRWKGSPETHSHPDKGAVNILTANSDEGILAESKELLLDSEGKRRQHIMRLTPNTVIGQIPLIRMDKKHKKRPKPLNF